MLTTTRKAILLDRLHRDGQVSVAPLAAEFGVSEDTLRRDLRDLAAEGRLVRVHGGAIPASPTDRPVEARRALQQPEKAALARQGAALIAEGMSVIVDGGTTHQGLAAALPRDRRCTVITHSPAVAASFEFHDRADVVLIGGRLFRHSMVAMGPETAAAYGRLRADLCLLGVTGVHPGVGLTTGDSDEAALKRVMMQAAGETAVLATPDKIGRASPWGIAALDALTLLVTPGPRPGWLPGAVQHLQAAL